MNAAAAEVNYTDGEHPLDRLRFRLHGQTAPVTAQLMYLGYYQLPLEVTKHPGSRDYKQALREMFASLGIPIALTRKDITHGLRFLTSNGLLPEWVITDGFGGADNGNS